MTDTFYSRNIVRILNEPVHGDEVPSSTDFGEYGSISFGDEAPSNINFTDYGSISFETDKDTVYFGAASTSLASGTLTENNFINTTELAWAEHSQHISIPRTYRTLWGYETQHNKSSKVLFGEWMEDKVEQSGPEINDWISAYINIKDHIILPDDA